MAPLTYTTKFTLALALLPPCMLSLWMMALPQSVSASTYAIFSALLLAIAGIALNSYRNGLAPGSMGQLLHVAETAHPDPTSRAARSISPRRTES